jgi:uncharacterized repeat protein (TIGR03803 family)
MKVRDNCFLLPVLIVGLGLTLAGHVTAQTFTVLHTFTPASGSNATNSDGANPAAGLILSGHTLYGTAKYGGSWGWGTVFALTTDGSVFVTPYHFTGGNDGANPAAELTLSNGTLYGTASGGGSSGHGTVFAVNPEGSAFTNLHSFTAPVSDSFGLYTNSDGAYPLVGLILSGNALYGAANAGGRSGHGTVFTVNTNGSGFATLHSFSSGSGAAYSSAGLILSGNTLYGANYGNLGNGTVFAVNTDGTGFTNYYAFTVGQLNGSGILTNSDGANPHSKLILSGETLYGTAEHGGSAGNGTVFAVSTNGTDFTTLHSFAAGARNSFGLYTNSDGAFPSAGLILSGNNLYGTANAGGSSGNGTVFMLKTDGTGFTNLYSFGATPRYPNNTNSDGANPAAGLILSGYTLYGTAAYGGSSGNGTVFSLSFAPKLNIVPSGVPPSGIILTWPANAAGFDYTGFNLQSGPAVAGPFTNIPGATSPYTGPIGGAQQFYRLSQ